jgi:hypothetical protein
MILASDVLDRCGRLLVPKGIELKEKHLAALPAWGIQRIDIQGEAEGPAGPEPWALEAAERETAALFAHTNAKHPAMTALREACHRRLAERIQQKGFHGAGR